MNFGKIKTPNLRTQTPSYHLAPVFTHRPYPHGPLRLGTIVDDLVEYFPMNQAPNDVVPIPDLRRYHGVSTAALADVQKSLDAHGGINAGALESSIGGNASLLGGRRDGDTYRIDNVETTCFYPEDDYYEKCLELHNVKKFLERYKFKKPIYLITGLKIAHRASITMESGRQIGGNTEASVLVPTAPVDVQVGAEAGVSSRSEVVSSFTQPDAFVLGIQVRKIYHKHAFFSGETKLATKRVDKGAVFVDDDEINDEHKEAGEVNYELHDLDEEDMKSLAVLKDEDVDEA